MDLIAWGRGDHCGWSLETEELDRGHIEGRVRLNKNYPRAIGNLRGVAGGDIM